MRQRTLGELERLNRKTIDQNQIPDDPDLARVQQIIRDCKLAALTAEAKTAQVLAVKALRLVEALELTTMEDITAAQEFRSKLWPSPPSSAGGMQPDRPGVWRISPETKSYVEELKRLM